MSQLA